MAENEKAKQMSMFIAAGTLLGMGIGWLMGQFVPIMFIGMGSGFLIYALIYTFNKER